MRLLRASALAFVCVFMASFACSEDDGGAGSGSGASGGTAATGGTGAAGSGGSGDAACPNAGVDTSRPCNVVAQDCNAACSLRCVLYRQPGDTGYLRPACTADDGKDGLFATCDRSPRSVGDDTCKKGLFCSIGVGRPKDAASMHVCLPYCLTSADCDADSFCIFATATGVPPAGYCAKRCDPFADECATGDACVKFASSDPGDRRSLACSNQIGAGIAGVACTGGDCAAGFSCETVPGHTGSICTAFCDDTHPCANGAPCLQANNADFKVCGLAPADAGADAATDAADAASD